MEMRLPSALAAAALGAYLFFKLGKTTGNWLFGFFAVLVLVTCPGYTGIHITRTGEYESLWLLWSTLFSFSLYTAVETGSEPVRDRALFLFFAFVGLGMLTKGIACMLYFIPGFAVYVLWRGKTRALLRSRGFYAGMALFVILVPGYYLLRELMNPGYWHAVCANELSTHFKSVDLELEGPFTRRYPVIFFVKRLVYTQFTYYVFFLPVSLYAGLRWSAPGIKKMVQFAAISGFTYLFVISAVGKKVPHYNSPAIICFSIIIAALLCAVFKWLRDFWADKGPGAALPATMAFGCVLLLLAWPYYQIVRTIYCPDDNWEGPFATTCRIFQKAAQGEINLNSYKLIFDTTPVYGPVTVLDCYRRELAEKGQTLHFAMPDNLQPGDKVIVFDSTGMQPIKRREPNHPAGPPGLLPCLYNCH